MWFLLLSLPVLSVSLSTNPLSADFAKCSMKAASHLCDPDKVLKDNHRLRVAHELKLLTERTAKGNGTGCDNSGITAVLSVVAKGTHKEMAVLGEEMKKWNVDAKCNNTLYISFAADTFEYVISRNPKYHDSVTAFEVSKFLQDESASFTLGNFKRGFLRVLHRIWKRAVNKTPLWSVGNYPNPTGGDLEGCRIEEPGNLCDPDEVLDLKERKALIKKLASIEHNTNSFGDSTGNLPFCERKGLTVMVALGRHFAAVSNNNMSTTAQHLLEAWNADVECPKVALVLIALDDDQLSIADTSNVGVNSSVFVELFKKQEKEFAQRNVSAALNGTLDGILAAFEKVKAETPKKKKTNKGAPAEKTVAPSTNGTIAANTTTPASQYDSNGATKVANVTATYPTPGNLTIAKSGYTTPAGR